MKNFWKERSSKYKNLDWVNNNELLRKCVEECFVKKDKIDFLDIGTGSGKILKVLDPDIFNIYGIDISPDMTKGLENYNIKICDIYNLSEDTFNKKFDVISARMVFHHLPEIKPAIDIIKRSLNDGGKIIICEGVPPDLEADSFFNIMFTLKEDRFVIEERKIVKYLYDLDFKDISVKSVFIENCSLNNWLDNSGISQKNIDAVKLLHYKAPEEVKRAYNMVETENDILMTWKFIIVTANL